MLRRVEISLVYECKGENKTNLVTDLHRNEPQFHQALGSFINQLHAVNVTKQTNIFEPHVSFKIEVACKNEILQEEYNRFENEIHEDLQ
jgi:hypothetical protein